MLLNHYRLLLYVKIRMRIGLMFVSLPVLTPHPVKKNWVIGLWQIAYYQPYLCPPDHFCGRLLLQALAVRDLFFRETAMGVVMWDVYCHVRAIFAILTSWPDGVGCVHPLWRWCAWSRQRSRSWLNFVQRHFHNIHSYKYQTDYREAKM